jgi:hypothetical protein
MKPRAIDTTVNPGGDSGVGRVGLRDDQHHGD